MIITCPSCYINFEAPDALIPSDGRMLQCSKCKNKWFFKPEIEKQNIPNLDNANSKTNKIVTDSIKTNVQIKKNENIILLPSLALVISFIIILIYAKPYLIEVMGFKQLYHIISYDDTNKLEINEIKITPLLKGNSNYLNITGKINNNSAHDITSPYLRIQIKDLNHNIIMQEILPYSASNIITPGQILPINYPLRLRIPYDKVAHVEIDIADNLDFLFELR